MTTELAISAYILCVCGTCVLLCVQNVGSDGYYDGYHDLT